MKWQTSSILFLVLSLAVTGNFLFWLIWGEWVVQAGVLSVGLPGVILVWILFLVDLSRFRWRARSPEQDEQAGQQ